MPAQREGGPPRKPPPLTPAQLARIIREAVGSPGWVSSTSHFRERAKERDFTMHDALVVLESGSIEARPKWNEGSRTWNYDVHGTDSEGEPLTVRIAVEGASSIVLITAFGKE